MMDYFGREPSVGDHIVYAVRRYSGLNLRAGTVTAVNRVQKMSGSYIGNIKVEVEGTIRTLTYPKFIIMRKPWE